MRMIDAEPLEKDFFECAQDNLTQSEETRIAFCTALTKTQLQPTIEATDKKAQWRSKFTQSVEKEGLDVWCSSCGGEIKGKTNMEKVDRAISYKYCPYCGAKMWWE